MVKRYEAMVEDEGVDIEIPAIATLPNDKTSLEEGEGEKAR